MSTANIEAPRRNPWYRSRWFNLVVGLLVTAACLGWALRHMAGGKPLGEVLTRIGQAFHQANYVTLLPIWGALWTYYWLKAWRWRLLLTPLGDFSTGLLFRPVMIGFAFNNLLPAHLGEFVRVFLLARQQRLSKSAVLSSVVLERMFDGITILLILGTGSADSPMGTSRCRRCRAGFDHSSRLPHRDALVREDR
jgi:uncharacterized protein (TIRG00374 family)